MRDAIILSLNDQGELVVTTDNSGAIGLKEQDHVKVPYETVGYFSFRVAVMECIAARAKPIAVVIQNFCGDKEWESIVAGVQKGINELELAGIQITGSTESNFPLVQSAVGINVIGLRKKSIDETEFVYDRVALIGLPLVGNEVIEQGDNVAPLSLFYKLSLLKGVQLWPVGSKGVGHELARLGLNQDDVQTEINLYKSSGPSTCFLIKYCKENEAKIKALAGDLLNPIKM